MASGWRSLQTLNAGTVPGYAFPRQPGLFVTHVEWTGAAAQGHTFKIVDPNDSTILLQGVAGNTLRDITYYANDFPSNWRDFQLQQISSGNLLIWYR